MIGKGVLGVKMPPVAQCYRRFLQKLFFITDHELFIVPKVSNIPFVGS